jgi:hypothetical protein
MPIPFGVAGGDSDGGPETLQGVLDVILICTQLTRAEAAMEGRPQRLPIERESLNPYDLRQSNPWVVFWLYVQLPRSIAQHAHSARRGLSQYIHHHIDAQLDAQLQMFGGLRRHGRDDIGMGRKPVRIPNSVGGGGPPREPCIVNQPDRPSYVRSSECPIALPPISTRKTAQHQH